MSDDISGAPSDVIARAAEAGRIEAARDEFQRAGAAADAVTLSPPPDLAYILARAKAEAEIGDRRAEAARQREWAAAGDGSTVLESDSARSERLEAEDRGVMERARSRWPRADVSAGDAAHLARLRTRSEQSKKRAQAARAPRGAQPRYR
jgi:hypothetical protein